MAYTRPGPTIRTGGEERLSNFLLWQSAYVRALFLTDVLWPDFTAEELDKRASPAEYSQRERPLRAKEGSVSTFSYLLPPRGGADEFLRVVGGRGGLARSLSESQDLDVRIGPPTTREGASPLPASSIAVP